MPARSGLAEQARASGSGFADSFSFGTADLISAALKAAGREEGSYWQRYQAALAAERAQDAFDLANFGAARLVGQGAGAAAGIGLSGGALGALRMGVGGTRIVPNVAHVLRLGVPLAAGSGALGGGLQVAGDVLAGRSPQVSDVAGAVAGGAAGGLISPFAGPRVAAAFAGATTPVIQSSLKGSAPSPVDVGVGGALGVALGGRSEAEIRGFLGKMNLTEKGKLGEALSFAARKPGEVTGSQRRRLVEGPRYTVADLITDKEIIEAKLGDAARLSKNQRLALRKLENYVVEHWLPRDLFSMDAVRRMGLAAPIIEVPRHLMLGADPTEARIYGP